MFQTLPELLLSRAETSQADPTFIFLKDGEGEEQRLFFAELQRAAAAIAGGLLQCCKRGDRAVLLFPTGPEFVTAFLACLHAGIWAVPAYPPRANGRGWPAIRAFLADSQAALILTASALKPTVEQLVETDCGRSAPRILTLEPLLLEQPAPFVAPSPDTPALIQYTSGSTGEPKGVVISHGNLMANLAAIEQRFSLRPGAVGVMWLPPYHDMGLIGGVLQPVYTGCCNVLMSPASFVQKPLRWLRAIAHYRAGTSGGPNFGYDLCVRRICDADRAGLDLSSWELAFNGAEPVSIAVLDRFTEAFAPCGFRREAFYPCYGMAEATLMVSGGKRLGGYRTAIPDQLLQDSSAELKDQRRNGVVGCGMIAAGHQLRIVVPESGRPAGAHEVGELWISGPSVAQGYWNKPEETERTFRTEGGNRWLVTGDLGFVRADEVFVAGRLKDIIFLRGRNVYPQDIEYSVSTAGADLAVNGCAAFAMEGDGCEYLCVVQELTREGMRRNDWTSAFSAVRQRLASLHEVVADRIVLIAPGTLPRTTSGKVRRKATRAALARGELPMVAQWACLTEPRPQQRSSFDGRGEDFRETVLAWLIDWAASETGLPADAIGPTHKIAELGLDSLQMVTLSAAAADWLGIKIDAEAVHEYSTLADYARWLAARRLVDEGMTLLRPAERARLAAAAERESALLRSSVDAIPSDCWDIAQMAPVQALAAREGSLLTAMRHKPYFTTHDGINGATTKIDGRELLNFASHNYLGLSGHPTVIAAASAAIERYGTSVSASRIISGQRPVHLELERALASFLGVQDCVTFVGANSAIVTVIGHLFDRHDLILYDELAHDSLHRGAALAGAEARAFAHNDWSAVDRLLSERRCYYRKVLIFIEGIYSMDGDVPDLPRFIEVKRRHKALLLVDEVLSIGVLGGSGRGIAEHFAVDPEAVDIWIGGISKAFASCGGYIAGQHTLVQYLRHTAPGFVYTTGMTASNAAAALAAIEILKNEPQRVARLQQRANLFLTTARRLGLNTGSSSHTPVIPIIVGDPLRCLRAYENLFELGIFVPPIVAPAVAPNLARLRFFVSVEHDEDQIVRALEATAAAIGPRTCDPARLSAA